MCGTGTRDDRSQLTNAWKARVVRSFDRAAEEYGDLAQVQQAVAEELASRVQQSAAADVVAAGLELGCGTGFLSNPLLTHYPNAEWLISDISQSMVDECRDRFGTSRSDGCVDFQVLDGENLQPLVQAKKTFDLIASSLAFQWFVDLPAALSGICERLNPGGQLHFATLADSNFRNLYDNFPLSGLQSMAPEYPPASEIELALRKADTTEITIDEMRFSEAYPNLLTFLNHLKKIGAATSGTTAKFSSSDSGSIAALRRAIKDSLESGHRVIADYHVLFVSAKKAR